MATTTTATATISIGVTTAAAYATDIHFRKQTLFFFTLTFGATSLVKFAKRTSNGKFFATLFATESIIWQFTFLLSKTINGWFYFDFVNNPDKYRKTLSGG